MPTGTQTPVAPTGPACLPLPESPGKRADRTPILSAARCPVGDLGPRPLCSFHTRALFFVTLRNTIVNGFRSG